MTMHLKKKTIEVVCNGHFVSFPDGQAGIEQDLLTDRVCTIPEADHGYVIRQQVESLTRPHDRKRRANAGLLPALRFLVRREGLELVEKMESRVLPLPELADAPGIIAPGLAPFVCSNERGHIRYGRRVDIIEIMASVISTYSQGRIAILGAHNPQLDRISRRLRKCLPGQTVVRRIPTDDSGSWVGISSFTQAATGDIEKFHIAIVVDALQALYELAEPALGAIDARFRLFGFLREDRRLAPTERDVLMATFGPAVLDIPERGCEFAKVELAWLRLHGPKLEDNALTLSALSRRAYWQHPARNRIITRLAKAFRSGDQNAWSQYPDIKNWMAEFPDRPPRVTLVVDTVEQAIALASQLPGWPVAAGRNRDDSVNLHGLAKRKRRLLQDRRSMEISGDQQIVTQLAAQNLRLAENDILLWAGGGQHAPEIPRSWLLRHSGTGHRMLLINIKDHFARKLAKWSDRRHE